MGGRAAERATNRFAEDARTERSVDHVGLDNRDPSSRLAVALFRRAQNGCVAERSWTGRFGQADVERSGRMNRELFTARPSRCLRWWEYILGLAFLCSWPFIHSGCQFGGKETTHEVIMIEPGQTVEIADENQIQIIVKKSDGREIVARRKLAGCVAIPKSVYRELRARAYPPEEK